MAIALTLTPALGPNPTPRPQPQAPASTSPLSPYPTPPHRLHPSDDEINEIGELIDVHSESVELNTGDLVVLDNAKWGHGREPYDGERKILVAMSPPVPRRTTHVPGSLNAASYC